MKIVELDESSDFEEVRDLNTVINPSEDENLFKTKEGAFITLESTRKIIFALLATSKNIVERNEFPEKSKQPEKVERNSGEVRNLNAVIKPSDDKYLFKTKDGARITLESARKIICSLRNELCENDDADTSGPSTSDSKLLGKHPLKKNQKTNLNPEREIKRTSDGGSSAKCPRYEKVEMKKPNKNVVEVKTDKKKLPDPNRSTYTDVPLQNHVFANGSFEQATSSIKIVEVDESPKKSSKPKKAERKFKGLWDINAVINPLDYKYLFKNKNGESITPESTRKFVKALCQYDETDPTEQSTSDGKFVRPTRKINLYPELKRKRTSRGGSSAKCPRYDYAEMKKIKNAVFDVEGDKEKVPDPDHWVHTDALVQNHIVAKGALIVCEMNVEPEECDEFSDYTESSESDQSEWEDFRDFDEYKNLKNVQIIRNA